MAEHEYHTSKMERCIKHLEEQGWEPGKAHAICYATLGEEANKSGAEPAQKADADGWRDVRPWDNDRTIGGVITQEIVDKQRDIINLDALDMGRFAKKGHLVMEHGRTPQGVVVLGECIGWRPNSNSIEAQFGVYRDGNPVVDAAWEKMKAAGDKGAFSVAGVPQEDPVCDEQTGICIYKRIAMTEVSWTMNPANQGAKVTFVEQKAKALPSSVLGEVIVARFRKRFGGMGDGVKVEAVMKSCDLCEEFRARVAAEGGDVGARVMQLTEAISRGIAHTAVGSAMPPQTPPAPAQAPPPHAEPNGDEQQKPPSVEERVGKLEAMVKEMADFVEKAKPYLAGHTDASGNFIPHRDSPGYKESIGDKGKAAAQKADAPPASPTPSAPDLKETIRAVLKDMGYKFTEAPAPGPAPPSGLKPGGTDTPRPDGRALVKDALARPGSLLENLQRPAKQG